MMERAHTELVASGLFSSLDIDGIAELIESDIAPPTNFASILVSPIISHQYIPSCSNRARSFIGILTPISRQSTGLGVASAGAGLVPNPAGAATSAILSVMSSALSLVPEPEPREVDTTTLQTTLGDILEATSEKINDFLHLAVGQGDGNYDELPHLGNQNLNYDTPIGAFFSGGTMLLQGEDAAYDFEDTQQILTNKMIDLGA